MGCRVAIVARGEGRLREAALSVAEAGGRNGKGDSSGAVLALVRDLAVFDNCGDVVEEAVGHFGAIDVVVNNVGVWFPEDLSALTESRFDAAVDANVKSALAVTKAAVPHLKRSRKGLSSAILSEKQRPQ